MRGSSLFWENKKKSIEDAENNNYNMYATRNTFVSPECYKVCFIIDIYRQFRRDINCEKPADECYECQVHSLSS